MAIDNRLTGANKDALYGLNELFKSYGIGSLGPKIAEFLQNGYSADTISLLLRETPEYKKRFAANETRRAKGLPVLSPAEYLATETAYRQVMRAAGLPPGFYDRPDDFKKFLESDVSPTEIQSRVTEASNFINSATQEQKAMFGMWYTKGDMIAYALDPARAEPLIGKAFTAAKIGGEAVTQGLGRIEKSMATDIADRGISAEQASQGFSVIAGTIGNDQKLAAISGGQGITQYDAMREVFFNAADVTKRRDRLASQERGRFAGSSAVGGSSLGSSSAGAI